MNRAAFLALFAAAMLALPSAVQAQTGDEARRMRQMALDFEGDAYFPGEWDAAESLLAQAEAAAAAGDDEAAAAGFVSAEDAFASISNLAVMLYAQAREDEIMEIRDRLVAAGARVFFPEMLRPADTQALHAFDLYGAGEFLPAREAAVLALAMFGTLDAALDVWQLRQRIRGMGRSDESADNMIGDAMAAYLCGDLPLAMEGIATAHAEYLRALGEVYAGMAETAESEARRLAGEAIREAQRSIAERLEGAR